MRKCNKKLRKGEYEELLDKFDQNGENDPKAPHITLSAGINSEAVTKSDPRGVLRVTLLEILFVLIARIRYFKLSSTQIISILRKLFLSSCYHLIVKLD